MPDGAPAATPSAEKFAAAVTAVTSAFGDPTRRTIYLAVRDGGGAGLTASQVAERFTLHPNVARHHLDKLAAGGYLEVHVPSERLGAGRPSKRYRATPKDVGLQFPFGVDDLLTSLVGRLLPLVAPEAAAKAAEEVGEAYGRLLAHQMSPSDGQRSFRAALQAVADALTAHGFAAHAEARGPTLAIVSEHCPFGDAALQHPVMCALDRGMVKGMLAGLYGDCVPETETSRPQGAEVCVTLV